jgi:hypothetical protein
MIMSSVPVELQTQHDRDKKGRRHALNRRLRSIAWTALSIGFVATVLGYIAIRIVA